MNEVLPSLGGVALFAAAGLGLAEMLPALRAIPLVHRLGYAYLLGIVAVSGSLWALSHFFGIPLRPPAVWATAAVPALAGLAVRALRRPDRRHEPRPRRITLAGTAVAGAVALICLGLLADAVTNPVGNWDSRMIWSVQARYIRGDGTVDATVLRGPHWYVDHPRYPLLLPVTQVAVLEAFRADEDRDIFRAAYAALFPAFLLVLHDSARRWAGRAPAALAALAAAGVPALTFWGDGGAASAYSDMPLACFYGAGLVLLLRSRRQASGGLAAGLLLAGAVLAKNEGSLLAGFALCIGLAAALPLLRRAQRPAKQAALLLATVLPVLLALGLLAAWRSGIPNRHDERYAAFVDLGDFWPEIVTRIPLLAPVLAKQMAFWEVWTLFWWVAPVVLAAGWRGWRGRRRAVSRPLVLGVAAPVAIAWGAYAVHWDPADLAPVTWNRFLVQGSLPLFLLLSLSLRDLLWRAALWRAALARKSHKRSRGSSVPAGR